MAEKLSPLASPAATRAILEAYGLTTKKALGQHFLINDGVVARICNMAELGLDDYVVEIGPGIGTLTIALLKTAGRVISIERDAALPEVLAHTCKPWEGTFTLLQADAMEITPEQLPFAPNKLVANLPYAVAASCVLHYFEQFKSIESQTIMVQAEVADRMCATPGTKNYGAYTVKLALYAHNTGRFSVAESNFYPPPRVKSAVVRFDRNEQALAPEVHAATTLMANAAFANRRKTISNSMKRYFVVHGATENQACATIPAVLEAANIAPTVRAEALRVEDFIALGHAWAEYTLPQGQECL